MCQCLSREVSPLTPTFLFLLEAAPWTRDESSVWRPFQSDASMTLNPRTGTHSAFHPVRTGSDLSTLALFYSLFSSFLSPFLWKRRLCGRSLISFPRRSRGPAAGSHMQGGVSCIKWTRSDHCKSLFTHNKHEDIKHRGNNTLLITAVACNVLWKAGGACPSISALKWEWVKVA